MAAHKNLAQQLYVAYYGRPADPAGLMYWAGQFEDAEGDVLTRALDAFGTSAEYTASIGELTSEQLVQRLYQQLFGREADAVGVAFYVEKLSDGSATLASIAQQIVDGAMPDGSDATALANKVIVANAFTGSVAATAGLEYEASDIAAAQAVLAMVGATETSLAAGKIAALTAVAGLADAVMVEFDLEGAISGLEGANNDKTGFLLAAKAAAIAAKVPLDNIDPKTPLMEASLGEFVAGAAEQLGVLLGDQARAAEAPASAENAPFLGATEGVRAALLADAKSVNANKLVVLEKAQVAAQKAVDGVPGLASAIAVRAIARTKDTAAETAETLADAGVTGAVANYNALTDDDAAILETAIVDMNMMTVVDGELPDLIVADATTKALGLAPGITEIRNPGITALLTAINTREAAEKAAISAATALTAAEIVVNDLDLNAAGVRALEALGAGFRTPVTNPTRGQITAEEASLKGAAAAATATVAEERTAAAVERFTTLREVYDAATKEEIAITPGVLGVAADPSATPPVEAVTAVAAVPVAIPGNRLTDALVAAIGAATEQKATDAAIEKAASALTLAESGVDALAVLEKAIAAAGNIFTDADLVIPVTLGAATFATVGDDIFLVNPKGPTEISLSQFDEDDTLVIGSTYLRNMGDVTDDGDDTVLEYFLSGSKDGAPVWTKVTLETSVFGSSAEEQEVIEITLAGVALATVDVTDGFLTIA